MRWAPRGTLLANLDRIVSLAQREAKLKETGQSTMFDMFGESVATPLPALELVDADVSKAEMLAWEKELLGVYVSEHPFSSAAVDDLDAHVGARQRDHAGDGRPRSRHRRHGERRSARSRRKPASSSSPSRSKTSPAPPR